MASKSIFICLLIYTIYFNDCCIATDGSGDDDSEDQDLCKEVFVAHSAAGCILYDDSKCKGKEGMKTMSSGGFLLTDQTELEWDVESVSIRKGCQLSIYSGKRFDGESHFFGAKEDDVHITLREDELLAKFDDNVNSAYCSCLVPYKLMVPYPHYRFAPYYAPISYNYGYYPYVGATAFTYRF
jgi:hypothetical protein